MAILAQFLLRLTFGLAVGMAVTSPQLVSSGYYRNHLYVSLGLTTLATLAAAQFSSAIAWFSAAAAVLSYFGSVCWLYESKRWGVVLLWLVAVCALTAALVGTPLSALWYLNVVTSGLLLGVTFAAMLLGHWYLNSPGMELAPLRRLLAFIAVAVVAQMLLSATGIVGELAHSSTLSLHWLLFLILRWSFGLVGILALTGMAWKTLNIPNTQSATGLLYVAVLGTFTGDLTAQLLSAQSAFPL